MKKVAWIKGPGIAEWESEVYEKINEASKFEITGICSSDNQYPLDNIKLPMKKLRRYKQINKIPGISQLLQYFNPINNKFVGFNNAIKDFEVLHTCENFNPFSYQCIKSGKPTIVTVWENIPFIRERGEYKKFKEEVNKKASHFIAVSEYTKRMLLIEGVPSDKITVIFPGINLKRFRPLEKDRELVKRFNLQGKKVLLSVGSLVHGNKGTKELLYALKLLNDKNTILLISGRGRLEESLKRLAKQLGIDKQIIFVGSMPYSTIEKLYSVCDIFVLPSFPLLSWDKTTFRQTVCEILLPSFQFYGWQEQFGYVLAEAMACGKPIVSTFCGAIPEVVKNNENAILTTPGNFYELSKALERLLTDERLRTKMGKAGRKLAEEKYDSRKTAQAYTKVYEKVLS